MKISMKLKALITAVILIPLTVAIARPSKVGIIPKMPVEEMVYVVLDKKIILSHYKEKKIKLLNSSTSHYSFFLAPQEVEIGVKAVYTLKIHSFYSEEKKITLTPEKGDTILICAPVVQELEDRPASGGKVYVDFTPEVKTLTPEEGALFNRSKGKVDSKVFNRFCRGNK